MNITPHTANLPLATVVNPPTDSLRRDNHQREIITQVTAANPSAAEKGVASDKERARTPAQVNEEVDFANLRKQAEHAASSISEQESQQGDQASSKQNQEEQQTNNNANTAENGREENDNTVESSKQAHADEIIIQQLQQRDKEVRNHELAHAATGGASTGSPSYTFAVGPDGKKYAVSGEVSVDLSSVASNPQATITKMQKVYAAALAPASPSPQDIKVAASAAKKIIVAQTELLALANEKENPSSSANIDRDINTNTILNSDNDAYRSHAFDTLINQTLSAQDAIISSAKNQVRAQLSENTLQSNEVIQRAHRIESFYFTVSQGYERPDNFQFELTA